MQTLKAMQRIPSTSIATVRPPTGGDEQHVGPTHLEQPRQESAQAQELGSFIFGVKHQLQLEDPLTQGKTSVLIA